MRHRFALVLAVLAVLILRTPQALAAGLPLIDSATIDYSNGTLIVTGQNFGSNPTVTQASTASFYYSSSELAGSPGYAWAAFFFNGHVTTIGNEFSPLSARAVRAGR
jgi:hypothetical protein